MNTSDGSRVTSTTSTTTATPTLTLALHLIGLSSRGYPKELIHAVEAYANGFHDFTQKPETDLTCVLIACDEICVIFYTYQKFNPTPFGDMRAASITKYLEEKRLLRRLVARIFMEQ